MDPRLKRAGVAGFNKPKRTPSHPTKSHVVVAKSGSQVKTIRFGQQGVSGSPKKVKKLATSSVWVENECGVEELDHDLSAAEEALERIKTDAPAQYLEKKLEAKNERSKRTIRTGPPSLFVLIK